MPAEKQPERVGIRFVHKFFAMNESGDSSIQVILGQVAGPELNWSERLPVAQEAAVSSPVVLVTCFECSQWPSGILKL